MTGATLLLVLWLSLLVAVAVEFDSELGEMAVAGVGLGITTPPALTTLQVKELLGRASLAG
tara:strand:+ start:516 stop:698 length:183 start_codon:yes stop_codon:yes gene_type:complete